MQARHAWAWLEALSGLQGFRILGGQGLQLRDDEKKILWTRPALSGRKVAIITGE
jgi:hypothetical protein